MAKAVYTAIGDDHFHRFRFQWNSSTIGGVNNASFWLGMPLFTRMVRSGTMGSAANNSGSGIVVSDYINQERVLLKYLRIRMNVQQVQENCRYRICIARMNRSTYATGTTQQFGPRLGWNQSLDDPQHTAYWKVLYTKFGRFDQPLYGTTTLRANRTHDFYLPFNRIVETCSESNPTDEGSWIGGQTDNDMTFIHIDTDDAVSSDGEYLSFNTFFEWKWIGLD